MPTFLIESAAPMPTAAVLSKPNLLVTNSIASESFVKASMTLPKSPLSTNPCATPVQVSLNLFAL
nr:MAG TPA: hypothetical protein [Caudoviricetes sp.]